MKDNAMLQPPCKFGESKWTSYWLTMLSSSSCNYVHNEHEYFDQYGPYEIPSDIMSCYSYSKILVNQNEIPIDISC